jgi:hypothetical protein
LVCAAVLGASLTAPRSALNVAEADKQMERVRFSPSRTCRGALLLTPARSQVTNSLRLKLQNVLASK